MLLTAGETTHFSWTLLWDISIYYEMSIIKLKDNRNLGYEEFGDPSGIPVFYFHGSGGSRLDQPIEKNLLVKNKIRFITSDRPGHGLSDYKEKRNLLDWANDMDELSDYLKISKFYLLGHSAGAPYALACSYALKNKVIKCGIISGLAPYNRPNPYKDLPVSFKIVMLLIRNFPDFNYFLRKQTIKLTKLNDEIIKRKLIAGFPIEDQNHLKNGDNLSMLVEAIKEGYKQGYKGPALDDIIINSPWQFDIESIEIPIDIWQGVKDRNVPFCQGEYQHSKLKNSNFYPLKDEAHLFILSEGEKILRNLLKN